LVEHLPCTQRVKSSNLLSSTKRVNSKRRIKKLKRHPLSIWEEIRAKALIIGSTPKCLRKMTR
jgi:hypothetical protein